MWLWLIISLAVVAALYALFVGYLIVRGSTAAARAAARFVPDCVVLFRRLLRDASLPRRKKVLLAALVAYLVSPVDIVPDFIPVAGYLDDAVIVALVLRHVLRGSQRSLIEQHWPGPPDSLDVILRLGGQPR